MTMTTSGGIEAPIVTHGLNRRSASCDRPRRAPIATAATNAIRNAPATQQVVMAMSDHR
jgi:hypothetical protein